MVQRNIFQFTPPLDLTLDLLQARSMELRSREEKLQIEIVLSSEHATYYGMEFISLIVGDTERGSRFARHSFIYFSRCNKARRPAIFRQLHSSEISFIKWLYDTARGPLY
ncbi:uncharacterized protein H6S33_003701 [Morchella sextelata]|uniref:uncharacterized protein n=1 Tax=Morchella sextelata TaxID=1174677 RepID=UPI001D035FD0|nr:uncharacterized protein H6S33_003701 [Morchella sextelata]KAH0606867.1 hypothetical protein H6S33_003701 [Morchella sextelata]